MINSNVTTITLDGTETAVEFEKGYPYYWITNKGNADIYVSLHPDITAKAEGVYTIAAGASERIGAGYGLNKFYILGSGEAYIRGEQIAAPPSFKRGGEGGDNKPTPTNFDMTNINAYFDVSGIDAENKIWTNAVGEGGNITFAEGSIVDESLMIPGNNYGLFPLAQNPEVIYLVIKKPIVENDMCIFSQGSTTSLHGYGLEIGSGTDGHSYGVDVFQTPYITIDVDVNKWHLFTVIRDWTDPSFLLCFCDAKYCGKLPTYNIYYTGNMYLNTSFRSSAIYYTCENPSYFKFIAAGGLPAEDYINTVTNNMAWLMKNVVNPANEEV